MLPEIEVGAPGAGDEVFLAAHEAGIQAQRDSQGRLILIIFHLSPAPVTIDTRITVVQIAGASSASCEHFARVVSMSVKMQILNKFMAEYNGDTRTCV